MLQTIEDKVYKRNQWLNFDKSLLVTLNKCIYTR